MQGVPGKSREVRGAAGSAGRFCEEQRVVGNCSEVQRGAGSTREEQGVQGGSVKSREVKGIVVMSREMQDRSREEQRGAGRAEICR